MNQTIGTSLKGRENNFDFIRFYAALAVIFSHSFKLSTPAEDPLFNFSSGRVDFGTLSVAIFFTISGLLITQSFHRSSSTSRFIRARILRIYPALIITIGLTILLLGPLLTTLPITEYFRHPLVLKYIVNISAIKTQYFLPGVFENNLYAKTVNGSLWTLPHEIACYASVLAIGLMLRQKYTPAIIALTFVSLLFWLTGISVNIFYFGIGSLAYLCREKIVLNKYLAILALTTFVINIYTNPNPYLGPIITGITFSYFLLFAGFIRTKSLKNFAKNGDFSYGLYIFAFPIQQTIAAKIPVLSPYAHFILSAIIAFIFSYASWHLVEKQALKLKKLT